MALHLIDSERTGGVNRRCPPCKPAGQSPLPAKAIDHRAGEIGEGLRLGPGPGDTIFHYLSKKHLSRYLHEIGFRWNQREPVLKTNEKSELKLVIKRLPVMAMLRSLLAHAPGRQLRRSINGGIYCPEPT